MKSALNHFVLRHVYGRCVDAAPSKARRLLCDTLFRVFGHRVCCHVPQWITEIVNCYGDKLFEFHSSGFECFLQLVSVVHVHYGYLEW